jgi:hypothetical protein
MARKRPYKQHTAEHLGLFDWIMLTLLGLRKRKMAAIATAPER